LIHQEGELQYLGGEPLLQPLFVYNLFKELKKYGIHTALDTSGNFEIAKEIEQVLEVTDLVLLDIKHIDDKKFSLFELLFILDNPNPTKKEIESWLKENTSLIDTEGFYLVDTGLRRGIITTKSLQQSVAKVIWEVLNATNKSDIFLKRVARSQTLSFKVLKYHKDYSKASTYAGLYDVLRPSALLSERTPNYRNHNGYKLGLQLGGNWETLLIEELLDQGIRPEFVTPKETKLWRDKTYKAKEVMPTEVFWSQLKKKIEENSK